MADITVSDKKDVLNENSLTFEEREKELEALKKLQEEKEKREKNSPFRRFAQMNLDRTKELRWLARHHGIAHDILYFLVDNMDGYNALMCSYAVLQEALDISKATITRNISILKNKGFIVILKSGTSNVYVVNDDLFWKSWGKNKKYSKFKGAEITGKLLLSNSEQTKDVKQKIEEEEEKEEEEKKKEKEKEKEKDVKLKYRKHKELIIDTKETCI